MKKSIVRKLRKIARRLRGHLPSALPVGAADFHVFAESIFDTYDLPDMPSYRHAIATMIMHLDPTVSAKPKKYFAKSIKKAMANQIAYSMIQEIKEQEKQAEEEAKKAKEATPSEELMIASEG